MGAKKTLTWTFVIFYIESHPIVGIWEVRILQSEIKIHWNNQLISPNIDKSDNDIPIAMLAKNEIIS